MRESGGQTWVLGELPAWHFQGVSPLCPHLSRDSQHGRFGESIGRICEMRRTNGSAIGTAGPIDRSALSGHEAPRQGECPLASPVTNHMPSLPLLCLLVFLPLPWQRASLFRAADGAAVPALSSNISGRRGSDGCILTQTARPATSSLRNGWRAGNLDQCGKTNLSLARIQR